MRFDVLTLFPEIPEAFFKTSIMAKAVEKGIISCNLVNIRDFAFDKHRSCDDIVYGGGAGMLLLPEPLSLALDSVNASSKRVIYVTPSGKPFNQELAKELSSEEALVFVCGRYEGELAALVIIDAIYRLIDGVISGESLEEESFSGFLLEYPQYTRPRNFKGREVPEVLLSGHHLNIHKWRLKKRIEKTLKTRPDLIEKARNCGMWTKEAEKILKEFENE